jgi:hypothetical protein
MESYALRIFRLGHIPVRQPAPDEMVRVGRNLGLKIFANVFEIAIL